MGQGLLALLFHAASQYDKELESYQDSENSLSQMIPSYTPTIKALSYARYCASRAATINRNETSILIVTMSTTPGHRSLPGVDDEKLEIQKMTRDIYRIKALESPTVGYVLENITGFDIAHFACHGSVDHEGPSNSHLLLQKRGPLGLVVDELTVSLRFQKKTFQIKHGLPIYSHARQQELRQNFSLMNTSILLAVFKSLGLHTLQVPCGQLTSPFGKVLLWFSERIWHQTFKQSCCGRIAKRNTRDLLGFSRP